MSFFSDNDAYEAWLRGNCAAVEPDLEYKHERMARDPFVFLRATFFRWAGTIEAICPTLSDAPVVLSVGDMHVENFGTWRDAEGRLIWGVNDFDEAAFMPWPFDLVRLATSIRLAPDPAVGNRVAAEALLHGYRRGLRDPRPTLLDENETWMRRFVVCSNADRHKFWDEIGRLPRLSEPPPGAVRHALTRALPKQAAIVHFATRRAGGGSLGRPRFVVIAVWRGGQVVREAKALLPSAWDWAHGRADMPIRFGDLAFGTYRAPEPYLALREGYLVRRLAADSRKVDLTQLRHAGLTERLLEAMGFDIGAIHAAGSERGQIRDDLETRPANWLREAAHDAAAFVREDFQTWKGRGSPPFGVPPAGCLS